jgi:hypothetical protein
MNKKITLSLFLMVCSITFVSAQIPNFDFELWTDFGSYEDPDGWLTLNSLSGGDIETVKSTEDAFSGLFAVRMENDEDDNDNVVTAMMVSGSKGLSDHPGFPYTKRPVSLLGYYIYSPKGNDSCLVMVYLTRFNTFSQAREIVGSGIFRSAEDLEDYEEFSVPLNYTSSEFPDSAYIVIYAGKLQGAKKDSRLYIDALSFQETATGLPDIHIVSSAQVFPNPANDHISISLSKNYPNSIINFYDLSGALMLSAGVLQQQQTVSVSGLKEGIYIYEITDPANGRIEFGKFVIQR